MTDTNSIAPATLDKLRQIERALQYAANHRFGDGDVTAMFADALALLPSIMEEVEGMQKPVNEAAIHSALEKYPKYLHNPLTGSEKGLIRDVFNVLKALPPAGITSAKLIPWEEGQQGVALVFEDGTQMAVRLSTEEEGT